MPQLRTRRSDQRLLLSVLALCIVVSCIALFYIKRDGLSYRDFKIFYAAARMLRTSPGTQLYDLQLQSRVQQDLLHIRPEETLPYNHPPFELLMFLPLSALSYTAAFYVWLLISAALGVASAAMIGGQLKQLRAQWTLFPYALVLCPFAFFMVLLEGQDSAVALFLLVTAWLSLRRGHDVPAGIWLGLALFKFQVFVPLIFLLALRKPRLLKGCAASAAFLAIVSAVMIGPAGVLSYIRSLTHMARASSQGVSLQYGMDPRLLPNLRGLLYGILSRGRPSLPPSAATASLLLITLLSLLLLVWTARQILVIPPDTPHSPPECASPTDLAFALAVVVSLLLSFHILAHDLTLLALPFAIVVDRLIASQAIRPARAAAFAAVMFLFYVYLIYLFLFAWSQVYWLGGIVMVFAALLAKEISAATPHKIAGT
jgi:hypothetical protein